MRWVLSDSAASQDATPGVFIATPAKSVTVTGNVTIAADAFDDGSVSKVKYRIDPVADGPFMPMTPQSGRRYTATWNSSAVAPGDHTIQVRVTDDTGKTGSVSHVVRVT